MKLLSIDTSTPRGSVALLDGDALVGETRLLSSQPHAVRLLPAIEYLLSGCAWRLADLDLVVVGCGPGSFTGIRIGVATGLGLAQTLGKPLAPVSTLDALGYALAQLHASLGCAPRSVRLGIVMDAGRGQVYYSEYRAAAGEIHESRAPVLASPDALRRTFRGRPLRMAGDGAVRYARELGVTRTGGRRVVTLDLFLAAPMARLALRRRHTWRQGDYLAAEPLYIRPPDALVQRRQGVGRERRSGR